MCQSTAVVAGAGKFNRPMLDHKRLNQVVLFNFTSEERMMPDPNEKRRSVRSSSESDSVVPPPPPLPNRLRKSRSTKSTSKQKPSKSLQITLVCLGGIVAFAGLLTVIVVMSQVRNESNPPLAEKKPQPDTRSMFQNDRSNETGGPPLSGRPDAFVPQPPEDSPIQPENVRQNSDESLAKLDGSEDANSDFSDNDDAVPPSPMADDVDVSSVNPTDNQPGVPPGLTETDTDGGNSGNSGEVVTELDAMINQAAGFMSVQKPKEAIVVLKRASFKFPKEIRPDFYLGLMYSGIGENDTKLAAEFYRKVLERSPGHQAASNNLGLVFINARKLRAACTSFNNASKPIRPLEVDQNMGRLQTQAAMLEAKKDDKKAIDALNPDLANYRSDRGWLYMPVDNSAKMLAEYRPFCRNGNLEDQSCSFCNGESVVKCRTCAGRKGVPVQGTVTGEVRQELNRNNPVTLSAPVMNMATCPTCNGAGKLDCRHCDGGRDPKLR